MTFLQSLNYILEKIVSALLETEWVEFGINWVPEVFIRDGINIVDTGIISEQWLSYLFEDVVLSRHTRQLSKKNDYAN